MGLKPACVPCQRFFQPATTGVLVLEQMPLGGPEKALPGTATPDRWQPYKLWQADIWRCPGCGAEIVYGSGFRPRFERHHGEFAELLAKGPRATINDC